MSQDNEGYSTENVDVLRDALHIRCRPGMYIGDTGVQGFHNLLFELINNAVDEFSAGPLEHVLVQFFKDGSCRVQDHGRGIPLERHGVAAELVFATTLTPGWKKDAKFRCEGGLRGIG